MTDETQTGSEPTMTDEGDARVMGLLSEHVPLSLLVDLADPDGPASNEILQSEGKPDDAWWVQEGAEGESATEAAFSDENAAETTEKPSDRA